MTANHERALLSRILGPAPAPAAAAGRRFVAGLCLGCTANLLPVATVRGWHALRACHEQACWRADDRPGPACDARSQRQRPEAVR